MKIQANSLSKFKSVHAEVGKLTLYAENNGEAEFLANLNKILSEGWIESLTEYIWHVANQVTSDVDDE